jgi:hypothetical protein
MALALASLVIMFHPDAGVAWILAAIVLPASIVSVMRHQRIAPPPAEPEAMPLPEAATTQRSA